MLSVIIEQVSVPFWLRTYYVFRCCISLAEHTLREWHTGPAQTQGQRRESLRLCRSQRLPLNLRKLPVLG